MKVLNIKDKKNYINYKNTKFENIINENKHLLPNLTSETISFTLKDTSYAFSNAIRRVAKNEIECKCFQINIYDIVTNDKFLLIDIVKDRIELIPISQSIDMNKTFSLNVSNNTDEPIKIYTKDIKPYVKGMFDENIIIAYLMPNTYLKINDIVIEKKSGVENGKYGLSQVNYKDIKTNFKKQSLEQNNITDINMDITTNGNIKIPTLINEISDNLIKRLTLILTNLKEIKTIYKPDDVQLVNNNDLFVINENNMFLYYINNETHTIGNLLEHYIYQNEKCFVNYATIHPTKNQFILKIKHPNHKKIIENSIGKIIDDVKLFQKSF